MLGWGWHPLVTVARRHGAATNAVGIALISVILSALGVGTIWGFSASLMNASPWWSLLTVFPGCVLVLMKDRAPLGALAAGTALLVIDLSFLGTVGIVLVLHDLIYAATASLDRRGRRAMLFVLLGVGVLATAATWFLTGDPRVAALIALLLFAVIGTPYWWATAVRQAEELAALHEERADDAARLTELRENEAVRGERERMARDLHDVIAGHLSAVALRSEAALARPADERRDRDALAAVRASSLRSLAEMRSMILLLRAGADAAATPRGLDRLDELIADASSSGVTVTLALAELPELPAAVDQAAARIAQEALVNAAKHASRTDVGLSVSLEADTLIVVVDSHGSSETAGDGTGFGLLTMNERADALGGRLRAGWIEPGTWSVRAELPIGVPG